MVMPAGSRRFCFLHGRPVFFFLRIVYCLPGNNASPKKRLSSCRSSRQTPRELLCVTAVRIPCAIFPAIDEIARENVS